MALDNSLTATVLKCNDNFISRHNFLTKMNFVTQDSFCGHILYMTTLYVKKIWPPSPLDVTNFCHEMLPALATIRWYHTMVPYDGHERTCREHSRHLLKFIVTNISKKEFFLIELFRRVRLLSCSCRTNIFIQFEIITSPSNLVLK